MKPLPVFLLSAMLIIAVSALGQGSKTAEAATAPTLASAVDHEISAVEKEVLDAAEAMPEDKFNFSPGLGVPRTSGECHRGCRDDNVSRFAYGRE